VVDAVTAGQTPVPATDLPGHLVELPGTGWGLWRAAMLRTTGFPVDGLERLSARPAAAAADRHLRGEITADEFDAAYAEALKAISAQTFAIANDPLFREAVTWQNRNALYAVDGIREQGPEARRNSRRRQREEMIAQYWQRYCAKNETVGFFGPLSWITLDPQGPPVTVTHGPELVRQRRIYFEHWALAAYADSLAADPQARRWLPAALSPHLTLDGRQVLRPAQAPVALSPAEAALLTGCDGRRPAVEIVEAALGDPGSPLRAAEDGFLLLTQLAERGLVHWGLDLPVRLHAEDVLARQLAAIGDPVVRDRAMAGFERLRAARDRVASAAGDPDRLSAALAALDEEFSVLTGREARRHEGEMYAGRTICVEECVRDLDVSLGAAVVEALAKPMDILLQAARWLTVAAAEAYLTTFRSIYQELAQDAGSGQVPFGQLWYLAQGLVFGQGELPIDAVSAEFTRRWAELFALDRLDPDVPVATYSSDELGEAVRRVFPAERPGWAAARVHGPDLHVCAESVEALARGDFDVVLGEMHAAWSTFDAGLFTVQSPDIETLRAATRTDIGPGRIIPLFPITWPRYTSRLTYSLDTPDDCQLGFVPAPGADPDRLLPVTALTVQDVDGQLVVRARDSRQWPLIEMFAELIGIHTQAAFKLVVATGHSPRIMVDRMVVARETWRTTVGETGLAQVRGEREQYLAARRWRAALGLPERVFVSVSTETKPWYLDLTSPVYVSVFCRLLRAAHRVGGDQVRLTVSEMYPTAEQAWLTDAAGRRYLSELRIQITDPQTSEGGRRG